MGNARSILTANDQYLVQMLQLANSRIVFVAPGVSKEVADALLLAAQRLGPGNVDVILDISAEVYRLGYGTAEGFTHLKSGVEWCGLLICHEPGLRIGLLVADNETLLYTPTPQLVESDPESTGRPNAILLGRLPDKLADDLGLGPQASFLRAVGEDTVTPERMKDVHADLERNRPVKFDLARKVRVYANLFQFVEFELNGVLLSRKKVPIPSTLMGMDNRAGLESRFHAQYTIVGEAAMKVKTDNDKWLDEVTLRKKKDRIANDYLVRLKDYGSVVQRSNKEAFEKAVATLRADVETFKTGIEIQIQEAVDKAADELADALLPAIEKNVPQAYQKVYGPIIASDRLRKLVRSDIVRAFGDARSLVHGMSVRLTFKDIAYESLTDEKFLKAAREAMPGIQELHEESEAAPAIQAEEP